MHRHPHPPPLETGVHPRPIEVLEAGVEYSRAENLEFEMTCCWERRTTK